MTEHVANAPLETLPDGASEQFLENIIKSGRRQNVSEVLREGLRLWSNGGRRQAERLQAAAHTGVGALDQGDFKEFAGIEDLQVYLSDLSEKIISLRAHTPATSRRHSFP